MTEGFNRIQWASKLEEVAGVMSADTSLGVSRWCETLAEAVAARNIDAGDFLVNEPFTVPTEVGALIERALRPGVAAWRDGRSADAARLLSAGVRGAESIVLTAIDGSPGDENEDSKQAATYALKSAWLEALGRTSEAASDCFEAGKRFGWAGETWRQAAIDLLSRAIELDPDLVKAYWHLSEAWWLRSFAPHPPYAFRDPLERSLAVWNAVAARQLPDASTSWPYVTRALMCEQQARLDDEHRASFWWQGVHFLERAILLDHSDSGRWAGLGRLHRLLENESCSLHATAEAVKRGPADSTAMEERAAILADTGRFDESLAIIDQRLAQDAENAWARGVRAYLLANRKEYRAALELIDQVIALEPENIWNLDLRALCCWMLGEREQALAVHKQIRDLQSTTATLTSDDRRAGAYAAYKLGRPDEAMTLLAGLSSAELSSRGDVLRTQGLCQFAKGNVARAEELLLSGIARAQAYELDAFLAIDLADLEARSQGWRRIPGASAIFHRVKKTTAALAAGLSRSGKEDAPAAALGELTAVLQALPDGDSSAVKLGAQAGAARLQLEQQQWSAAAGSYRELQRSAPDIPEAVVGIDRAVDGLRAEARSKAAANEPAAAAATLRQLLDLITELSRDDQLSQIHEELGDALWWAGDPEAFSHFRQALTLLSAGDSEARLAKVHARIALALQQQGDQAGASKGFIEALRRLRASGSPDPGAALSQACRPLILSARHFWAVDAAWDAIQADAALPEFLRADIGAARVAALAYLDDLFGLSKHADASVAVPTVSPISLEVGSGLVPMVDPKADGGKFLYEHIPAMRNGIESSTGVRMPGISVRGDAGSTDRYVILLDEATVARGAVCVGSRYSVASPGDLAAAGVSGDGVIESADPVSGEPGHWCSPAQADELARRGVPVLTETQFVLAHVDLICRQHLDGFFGVQEFQFLIAQSKKKAALPPGLESALADDTFRLFAARLLRALAREQVPITGWLDILETVRHSGSADMGAALSTVRMTRRDLLPGNREPVEYVEIPAEWQDLAGGERAVFKASPADAHRLLADVRRLLESRTGPVALVTPTALLRPLVRRLIEFEFPSVPVIARDEILSADRLMPLAGPAALEAGSL